MWWGWYILLKYFNPLQSALSNGKNFVWKTSGRLYCAVKLWLTIAKACRIQKCFAWDVLQPTCAAPPLCHDTAGSSLHWTGCFSAEDKDSPIPSRVHFRCCQCRYTENEAQHRDNTCKGRVCSRAKTWTCACSQVSALIKGLFFHLWFAFKSPGLEFLLNFHFGQRSLHF